MRKSLLLLIVAVISLSAAGTASSDPLISAVCLWKMENEYDLNGPIYTDIDWNIVSYPPVPVVGIHATNSNHWALPSEAAVWTWFLYFDPPYELIPSGAVSIFTRVKFASFTSVDVAAGLYDGNCPPENEMVFYAIEVRNSTPEFRIWGQGESGPTSVSTGFSINTDVWYDIMGVFDPDNDKISIYIYSPVTGNFIGSATNSVSFDSIATIPGPDGNSGEFEMFQSPCGFYGGVSGALMDMCVVWDEVLSPSEIEQLSTAVIVPEVWIFESGGSTEVTEGGASDSYDILLSSEPAAEVTIAIETSNSEIDVDTSELTFTTSDWNEFQTVNVTAVDDVFYEGQHSSTITHTTASADPCYHGLVDDVGVDIIDNDWASVSIIETDDLTMVHEGGATDSYDVLLTSEPSANVTLSIDDSNPQVNVDTSEIVFTTFDWDVPRTVTVTAVDDMFFEGPHATTITHNTVSSDPNYDDLDSYVWVDILDNDRPGDLNKDGYVDFNDLNELTDWWLDDCFPDNWCNGADLSGLAGETGNPGIVNFVDFAIFADLFLDQRLVLITEFMAVNTSSLLDEDGDDSDWLEIYNAGTEPVDMNGWYLTDDEDNLTRWRFPNVVLDPCEFLVVFASGKNRAVPGSELHTNFELDGGGEYLALVKPDGVTVSHSYAPEYPKQYADVSYGRGTNGVGYLEQPTPGQGNGSTYAGVVADTAFSANRGFYDGPFQVEISTDTPGATIRYTLTYIDASSDQGEEPDETTGTIYTVPITIDKTTCLRAMAYKPGFLSTNVDTQTYIFLDDVLTQAADGNPPPGWPSDWGYNDVDYGMDPDIVDDPEWGPQMKD
ncbi:lamin tail domain-containing protein, partial [Planctomycetota bacterium]